MEEVEDDVQSIHSDQEEEDEAPALIPEENHAEGENEGNNEENEEESTQRAVVAIKKKIVRNPQPKFNADRLCGPRGISDLLTYHDKLNFKGKDYEKEDLDMVMAVLQQWTHRLFPKMPFDSALEQIENLGKKKQTKVYVTKIRMGLPVQDNDFISEEPKDDEDILDHLNEEEVAPSSVPNQDSVFDELLRTQREMEEEQERRLDMDLMDLSENDQAPFVPPIIKEDDDDDVEELTEEQKERMKRNREKAKQRKMQSYLNLPDSEDLGVPEEDVLTTSGNGNFATQPPDNPPILSDQDAAHHLTTQAGENIIEPNSINDTPTIGIEELLDEINGQEDSQMSSPQQTPQENALMASSDQNNHTSNIEHLDELNASNLEAPHENFITSNDEREKVSLHSQPSFSPTCIDNEANQELPTFSSYQTQSSSGEPIEKIATTQSPSSSLHSSPAGTLNTSNKNLSHLSEDNPSSERMDIEESNSTPVAESLVLRLEETEELLENDEMSL